MKKLIERLKAPFYQHFLSADSVVTDPFYCEGKTIWAYFNPYDRLMYLKIDILGKIAFIMPDFQESKDYAPEKRFVIKWAKENGYVVQYV